jgi:DNA-binding CsgD family transcriptional regulator
MTITALLEDALRRDPSQEYGDLARQFGCSRELARQVGHRLGLPPRCAPIRPITRQELATIATLNAVGCCDAEIARQLGRNITTVREHRSALGLPAVDETFTAEQRTKAVRLVASGKTYGQAARATGMTREAVAGAVHRAKKAKR